MQLCSAALLITLVGCATAANSTSTTNLTSVRRRSSTSRTSTLRASSSRTSSATTINTKCRFVKDKCEPGSDTHRHASFADRNCYCDSVCTTYDDCCPNFEQVQDAIGAYYVYKRNQPKLFECLTIQRQVQQAANPNIYVFTKCPANWSDERVRMLCEGGAGSTGVGLSLSAATANLADSVNSVNSANRNVEHQFRANFNWFVTSQRSKLTYRNYFCSLCNNDQDTLLWPLTISCIHRDPNGTEIHPLNISAVGSFSQLLEFSTECHTQLRMPLPDDVTYCHKVISTCPNDADAASDDVRQCYDGPYSHVYSHSVPEQFRNESRMRSEFETISAYVFKNAACARCNLVKANDTEKCHSAVSIGTNTNQYRPIAFAFAALFEPRRPQSIQVRVRMGERIVEKNFVIQCPDGTVFAPLAMRCVANDTNDTLSDYSLGNSSSSFIDHPICDNDAEAAITVSLVTASCVALAAQITTYCLFRPLRNAQGQLVLCFSVNLLAMYIINFLAMVPDPGSWQCKMVAVACHFVLLSAFFWMQTLIFDVWQTVRYSHNTRLSVGAVEDGKGLRRLMKYALYCYGCPLMVVTVSLLMEYMEGDQVRPHYGTSGNCWLTDGDARLFYFGLPVSLIVGSTSLLLLSIFIRVSKIAGETNKILRRVNSANASQNVAPSSPGRQYSCETLRHTCSTTQSEISFKKRLFLFSKLCVLGGFLWLIGLLYEVTGSCVLNYIFTLCCASQGIAVALMFVSTKKVWKLVRGRFSGKRSVSTNSQQACSHTGNSKQSMRYSLSTKANPQVLRKCHSIPGTLGIRSVELNIEKEIIKAQLQTAKSTSQLELHRPEDENSVIQHENRQNIARFIDEKIDNYKFGAKPEPIYSDCNVQHESVRHRRTDEVISRNKFNPKAPRQCNTVS